MSPFNVFIRIMGPPPLISAMMTLSILTSEPREGLQAQVHHLAIGDALN